MRGITLTIHDDEGTVFAVKDRDGNRIGILEVGDDVIGGRGVNHGHIVSVYSPDFKPITMASSLEGALVCLLKHLELLGEND